VIAKEGDVDYEENQSPPEKMRQSHPGENVRRPLPGIMFWGQTTSLRCVARVWEEKSKEGSDEKETTNPKLSNLFLIARREERKGLRYLGGEGRRGGGNPLGDRKSSRCRSETGSRSYPPRLIKRPGRRTSAMWRSSGKLRLGKKSAREILKERSPNCLSGGNAGEGTLTEGAPGGKKKEKSQGRENVRGILFRRCT